MNLKAAFGLAFSLVFALATHANQSNVDLLMRLTTGQYKGKTSKTLWGLKIIPERFFHLAQVTITNDGDGLQIFYKSNQGNTSWSLSRQNLEKCLASKLNQAANSALSSNPNSPTDRSENKSWTVVLEAEEKRGTLIFVGEKLMEIEITHGDFGYGEIPTDGFAIQGLEKIDTQR